MRRETYAHKNEQVAHKPGVRSCGDWGAGGLERGGGAKGSTDAQDLVGMVGFSC